MMGDVIIVIVVEMAGEMARMGRLVTEVVPLCLALGLALAWHFDFLP